MNLAFYPNSNSKHTPNPKLISKHTPNPNPNQHPIYFEEYS